MNMTIGVQSERISEKQNSLPDSRSEDSYHANTGTAETILALNTKIEKVRSEIREVGEVVANHQKQLELNNANSTSAQKELNDMKQQLELEAYEQNVKSEMDQKCSAEKEALKNEYDQKLQAMKNEYEGQIQMALQGAINNGNTDQSQEQQLSSIQPSLVDNVFQQ